MEIKKILIFYFLAILILFFVSLPLFHDYLVQRAILIAERENLEHEEIHLNEMMKIKSELVPYSSMLRDIERGLPADPALPSLIRHLEELVVNSGLQMTDMGPFSTTELTERPNLRETSIEMKVVSNSYDSLKNFIEELERSIRLVNISSATIASEVDEENRIRFSLSLSLKTYSY